MRRRFLSAIVTFAFTFAVAVAVASSYAAALGARGPGGGDDDALGAAGADQSALCQVAGKETRLARSRHGRTAHGPFASLTPGLAPARGPLRFDERCAGPNWRALFSPGACLISGRTSRGPPGRAPASSES